MDTNIVKEGQVTVIIHCDSKPKVKIDRYYMLYGGLLNSEPRMCYCAGDKNLDTMVTTYFEDIENITKLENGSSMCFQRADSVLHELTFTDPEECDAWFLAMKGIKEGEYKRNYTMKSQAKSNYININDEIEQEENAIYDSQDSDTEIFRVKVSPTDASMKSLLQGEYDLLVGTQNMKLLRIKDKMIIYVWPYVYLRRTGGDNSLHFVFEAGRKCDSADGMFKFRCHKAETLRKLVNTHTQNLKKKKTAPPINIPERLSDIPRRSLPSTPVELERSKSLTHSEKIYGVLQEGFNSRDSSNKSRGNYSELEGSRMQHKTKPTCINGGRYSLVKAKYPQHTTDSYQELQMIKDLDLNYERDVCDAPVIEQNLYEEYDYVMSSELKGNRQNDVDGKSEASSRPNLAEISRKLWKNSRSTDQYNDTNMYSELDIDCIKQSTQSDYTMTNLYKEIE